MNATYKVTKKYRKQVRKAVSNLRVHNGSHGYWSQGHCVMEIVSHFPPDVKHQLPQETDFPETRRTKKQTDHPYHADSLLTSVMIRVNDAVNGNNRQLLKALVPWLIGSHASSDVTEKRFAILAKAILARIYSEMGKPLCQKLCPSIAYVEKGNYTGAHECLRKVFREIQETCNLPYLYSAEFKALAHLVDYISSKEALVSVVAEYVKDKDFEKERKKLRFFIKTVRNIFISELEHDRKNVSCKTR